VFSPSTAAPAGQELDELEDVLGVVECPVQAGRMDVAPPDDPWDELFGASRPATFALYGSVTHPALPALLRRRCEQEGGGGHRAQVGGRSGPVHLHETLFRVEGASLVVVESSDRPVRVGDPEFEEAIVETICRSEPLPG